MRLPRAKSDVHPLVLGVPARLVDEAPLVERRLELAVHGVERVADERLGHAVRVVVRGLEPGDVLDEVEADEERVVVLERARDGAKKRRAAAAGRGSRSCFRGTRSAAAPPVGSDVEIALEVADDRVDDDAWIRRRDRLRARAQGLLAHVEWNEALERRRERVEEETRVLLAFPAPSSTSVRARVRAAISVRARQDLALAPRQVVLRQPRDLARTAASPRSS